MPNKRIEYNGDGVPLMGYTPDAGSEVKGTVVLKVSTEAELDAAIEALNSIGGGIIQIVEENENSINLTSDKVWNLNGITIQGTGWYNSGINFNAYKVTLTAGCHFRDLLLGGNNRSSGTDNKLMFDTAEGTGLTFRVYVFDNVDFNQVVGGTTLANANIDFSGLNGGSNKFVYLIMNNCGPNSGSSDTSKLGGFTIDYGTAQSPGITGGLLSVRGLLSSPSGGRGRVRVRNAGTTTISIGLDGEHSLAEAPTGGYTVLSYGENWIAEPVSSGSATVGLNDMPKLYVCDNAAGDVTVNLPQAGVIEGPERGREFSVLRAGAGGAIVSIPSGVTVYGNDGVHAGGTTVTLVENEIAIFTASDTDAWVMTRSRLQYTAEQTDYLVGPAGTARYTNIQDAINQAVLDGYDNDNAVTVHVLPGTYTENISLKPGVSLKAVKEAFTQAVATNSNFTEIVGTVTFDSSGVGGSLGVNIDGFNIAPTTGSTIFFDGDDNKTISFHHCSIASPDADLVATRSGTGQGNLKFYYCNLSRGAANKIDDVPSGSSVTLTGSTAGGSPTADSFQLSDGSLRIYGAPQENNAIIGRIYVPATTTGGTLEIQDVYLWVLSGNHVQVDGVIGSGKYRRLLDFATRNTVTIGGTNENLLKELPANAVSGDMWQYNGNSFDLIQLAAQQTEFLVGPAGTAKYSDIQSAINAASTGSIVWVLPGTYTGNVEMKDGVELRGVVNQKESFEYATIIGTVSAPTDISTAFQIHGIRIEPASGASGVVVTPDAGIYTIPTLIDVMITSRDAPAVNFTKGSGAFITATMKGCTTYRMYSAVVGSAVIVDGADLSTSGSSYSGKIGSNTVAIELKGGGSLYVGQGEDEFDIIWGKIDVSGGTDNELHLRTVRMDVDSGDHVTVTGTLATGKGLYRDAVDADTEEPITIGGTNADDLIAVPSSMEIETICFRSPAVTPSYEAGKLFYDDGALTLALMTGRTNVVNQVGQEIHSLVYNDTGSQINNGQMVYRNGSITALFPDGVSRRVPTVDLAKADTLSTSIGVAGMATENIPNGSLGMITSFGIVRDLNTTGLSLAGPLYLSASVAGAVTNTRPAAPNRVIVVGGLIELDAATGKINIDIDRTALDRPLITRSYSFTSQGIGSGTFYTGGFYRAPSSSTTRTQAAQTITLGSANEAHASHAFAVFAGAGTVDTGQVGLRVTGTSYQDDGTRTTSDSEVLTDDITTLSLNQYLETAKKWLGVVTWELFVVSGTPTTYSLTFNYGFAKYDDIDNRDFYVLGIECVGLAGASDSNFNIELLHHKTTGWTYSAGAFVPGDGAIVQMSTDMGPDDNLYNGQNFAWKHVDLSTFICGNDSEGTVIRITTGNPNTIQSMDLHMLVAADPKP
jgi:hypothetical protein